ncbi:unnamed protein product [Didymodactylos carnosus]|uniref:Uncharacterized protein n=1 Tax=Didymodactylos carnosus TaxID=1234261 RepID=A0A814UF70_9BILA|nr:unnamed protein product [Didymodactylos carnosus]CAF1174930.1 unnamed protein product [Didymodactylos carnosus]CAF3656242.1 unnamed protein product [Didymodactylos carnosus]CAF3938855.1 unnamed protein product [Didymodactylos carnosus]
MNIFREADTATKAVAHSVKTKDFVSYTSLTANGFAQKGDADFVKYGDEIVCLALSSMVYEMSPQQWPR